MRSTNYHTCPDAVKKTALLIMMLALVSRAIAALPECIFQRYTSMDGLPHNYISAICHDHKGFVWICTWYGLSRFDGYTFKNYRTLPGDYSPLSHNRFLGISEDSSGDLWLTTYDHRIYCFDRRLERFEDIVSILTSDDASSHNIKVERYLNCSDGTTWIVFSDGVLAYARRQADGRLSVECFADGSIGKKISLLFEDGEHNLWVVSNEGIVTLRVTGDGFKAERRSKEGAVAEIVQMGDRLAIAAGNTVQIYSFGTQRFESLPVAAGDRVTALDYCGKDNLLYAGTVHGNIFRYDPRSREWTQESVRTGRIRDIVSDSYGLRWITTAEAGIGRYDPVKKNYRHFVQQINAPSYYLDTITRVEEHNGMLWIKMNRVGFGYYDRADDKLYPFYNDPTRPDCRMSNGVAAFDIDPDNVMWMSTSKRGLERITIIQPKATLFAPETNPRNRADTEIRAVALDSHQNLWMANKGGELLCYSADGNLKHRFPDRNTPWIGLIYSIMQDSRGDIWLGTKGDGVLRMRERPAGGYDFTRYRHDPSDGGSLSDNNIYSIAEDRLGKIWIASYGGGINLYEETADGRGRFLNQGNSFPHYPAQQGSKVRYLLQAPDGTMLAATVEGLIIFDPSSDPSEMSFRVVQKIPGDIHSLGNNDIIHILADSKGRVWLSTFGGGLNLFTGYDQTGEPRFDIFSAREGLASNIVFAATEDRQGCLWLSTENGISKFDPVAATFSNYSRYDGIPTTNFSEATALTDPRGRVVFGSVDNLYIIDPYEMRTQKEDFRLTFTGFELRNEEVQIGSSSPLRESVTEAGEIVLPYDFSLFRISFASLNSRMQFRIGYMYTLEGYDKDWNIVHGARWASYSNLPGGRYLLRVRCYAENSPGLSDEITMTIVVRPPWWRTVWACMAYAVLAGLILWVVIRTLYTMFSLRNKVKMEQKITELKLHFFTNISHELRTPLTLILGGVEEVKKRETLSPQGETNINLAQKNAKRMLALINQLLDFRKIVNDKMELRIRQADIVEIAQGTLEDFREMAAEHHIELVFATSQKNLQTWIDPDRIEGVIYNLLANAFKFTGDGGRIELSVSRKEGDETFTFSVRDNGVGIPKDKIDTIFERFTQAGEPVSSAMKGSGIGLALCREVVSMHGGEISVLSRQGEGSVFTVSIPMGNAHFPMQQIDFAGGEMVQVPSNGDDAPAAGPARREGVGTPGDSPHILLVEDNREMRVFIYNQLIDSYFVDEAADGNEAMERIAEHAPDIIVTDLMMPVMDGIELVNRVRNDFNTSHIPIIMLTARTAPEKRIEAMKYGADDYITKPFSIELLQVRIDSLLRQRRNLFERYSTQAVPVSPVSKVIDLSPTEIVVTDRDEEFMCGAMKWIEDNIENPELTIDQLATHLGMGRTTMYNKLKALTGKSPVELIKEYRINKARMLLETGQFSVSEVAYKVGFSDPSYFSKCFREYNKVSPAEWLKKSKAVNAN